MPINEFVRDNINVGNIGAGAAVAIGRGATVTVTNNIIYQRVELQAPLRELFDPLIENRRAYFGGRKQALDAIKNFIETDTGGYLVITAGAGFGKTSLMATLVGSTPNAFAYHFFTPLYGERSLSETFFLRNIVQQMAQWHGDTEDLPVELDKLSALFHHYLDQTLDQKRIMVLDGLDEVSQWKLAPYLQRRLPKHLHIIVTIRDVGQSWQQNYGFPRDQITHLRLGGLSTEDIQAVLTAASQQAGVTPKAPQLAADAGLVAEISRVAATDPQQPKLGADPFYVGFLAADLAAGKLTPEQMLQMPEGLNVYLDAWWQAIRDQAGDKAVRDLFGTLTAAYGRLSRTDLEAINQSLVDEWAGDYFNAVLAGVRRFVVGDEKTGYALIHPRLQTYLQDPGRIRAIPVYAAKLLDYCLNWQENRSPYALRFAVIHCIQAEDYASLFTIISDPAFRETQSEVLGDSQPTLDDVKLALNLALQQDLPLQQIACVAAYRDTLHNQALTSRLFNELSMGQPATALTLAERYLPAQDWPRLLHLFIGLEAAFIGNVELALKAVARGLNLPARRMDKVSDRLITAVASQLAHNSTTNQDARTLLMKMLPNRDIDKLLTLFKPAPPINFDELTDLIQKIEPQLTHFEQLASEGDSEAVMQVMPAIEKEAHANRFSAGNVPDLLYRLATDPIGRDYITRTMRTILPNPYKTYRDIGLEVICLATLAAPLNDSWAQDWRRHLWGQIFAVTLEREGAAFTFELPFLLYSEVEKRNEQFNSNLKDYCDYALYIFDKWGTRIRVHSAKAAQILRQGNREQAESTLSWLAEESHGYAGFATQHLLFLATRWLEFGKPQRVTEPISQWISISLDEKLDEQVAQVRDAAFRRELKNLISTYRHWRQAAQAPTTSEGLEQLARLQTSSERSVYIYFLSAFWSQTQTKPNLEGLKALLPLVLNDGTLVDLVLARMLEVYLTQNPVILDETALAEVQDLVNSFLTIGRPWQNAQGPQIGY